MTGLWAIEVQMPYQKYQGPPIVVRWGMELRNNTQGMSLQPGKSN